MNAKATVFDCHVIHFPKIHNRAGNLTPIQNNKEVPFGIKRVYYLYDVPGGESRGAHGHRILQQVLIAASGSFDVTLDDGKNKKTVQLNRPYVGLHVCPGLWRDISNFSSGAICLVLASECYDATDYFRDYNEFLIYKNLGFAEFTTEFLDLSFIWLNDPEIKKLTNTQDVTRAHQWNWFESLHRRTDYKIWGITYNDNKIGAVGLKNIHDDSAEYFGYIGEKRYWYKGISKHMIDFTCAYAKSNGITDLRLRVIKDNAIAIKAYQKYGFEVYSQTENELLMRLNCV